MRPGQAKGPSVGPLSGGGGGGIDVFDTYADLVAANPSSGFAWLKGFGEFQKWEARWLPSAQTANHKLFQYMIDYVGKGNQRSYTCPAGQFVDVIPCPVNGAILGISPVGPNNIIRSVDGGLSWSTAAVAAAQWRTACSSVNNGWIYAFNVDLPLQRAAISIDNGATWTLEATPVLANITWRSACWDWGHDRVVCVGYGSATNQNAMFKQDTGSWSLGTTANNNDLLGVCFDTKRNRLVAVGNAGGVDRCQISTDGGSTWSTRNMPSASSWISVCYSSIRDRLFAVAFAGPDRMAYSDDGGDTWVADPSFSAYSLFDVAEVTDWCRIVCVDASGLMLYSDDYGAGWNNTVGGAGMGACYSLGYDPSKKALLVGGLGAPYITRTAGNNL